MLNKQNKVLKKIYYKNGNGKRVQQAKFNPNDEFYTGLEDIHKELNYYGDKFKGKNIICPCDCDIIAGEPVYKIVIEFMNEPEEWFASQTGYIYNVEKLTYYTLKNNRYVPTIIYGDAARNFISEHIRCNFIRAITTIGEDYGVKSITASGFDTLKNEGIKFDEVNYSLYDLIITNPPFSQYTYFLNTIMPFVNERKGTKRPLDFILLSSFLNRVNPNVGLRLQLSEFYLGYGRHKSLKFMMATKSNDYKSKTVAVDWITTFDDAQCKYNSITEKTGIDYKLYSTDYEVLKSVTMRDGTHPIRIANKLGIPDNYNGWMQGSIGILSNLNFNDFEWYITNAKKYYNTDKPEANPFNHKVTDKMLDFHGVVIRRKPRSKAL